MMVLAESILNKLLSEITPDISVLTGNCIAYKTGTPQFLNRTLFKCSFVLCAINAVLKFSNTRLSINKYLHSEKKINAASLYTESAISVAPFPCITSESVFISNESLITILGLFPNRFLSDIIFDVVLRILSDNCTTCAFLLIAGTSVMIAFLVVSLK